MNTIRASDAEREDVARILQNAAGTGRLSAEEAGERLAQASSARFREELAALLSDLPDAADLDRQRVVQQRPRFSAWLLWPVLRAGFAAMLFIGLWGFGLRWFFWPVWPLALLFVAASVARGRWRWRRRGYWGPPYWGATRYNF